MKTILKLILIFAVLAISFSSCIVREGGYGGHYGHRHYSHGGYYH
ncbi:MAG TPA: hypothetical protein VIL90_05270 [Puia sp.]